jgi:protein O-GlcNAc transferase
MTTDTRHHQTPMNTQQCRDQALSLMHQGRMDDGLQVMRSYVEQCPDDAMTHSMLLFFTHYLSTYDKRQLFEGYRQWALRHAPLARMQRQFGNDPSPHRRLRIGYLSPDFHTHAVVCNVEVLLRERNHARFELFGYGSVSHPDASTERLSALFDHYRDVYRLSDVQLARQIEQDQIDILVEIAGHVAGHRLRALASKPAPIQVDYQGINTTGMPQIDYCLTDAFLDPPGRDDDYVEKVLRLPNSVLCYTPPTHCPPLASLPYARNGTITFGSFNASLKVNPYTVGLWAQVLRQVPDSHLLIKFNGSRDDIIHRYKQCFARAGVALQRVRVMPREPSYRDHLDLYNQVDIGLDTYPFNGCVTTLESLWMGVPVISLAGHRYVSRMGSTILNNCGLEAFVASGPEQFVAKAAALAGHPDALAGIRMGMRSRILQSPLGNAQAYARHLEEAYLHMWHQWCSSQIPAMQE